MNFAFLANFVDGMKMPSMTFRSVVFNLFSVAAMPVRRTAYAGREAVHSLGKLTDR